MELPASLVEFLRPHCRLPAGEPRRAVTCRIGKTKERARTWSFDRLLLDPDVVPDAAAREVVARLETERRSKPSNAYVEVYVQGATHPLACFGPVGLIPEDSGGRDDALDDALSDGSLGGVVRALVSALSERAAAADARINHLENIVQSQHSDGIRMAVDLAEARAALAAGDDGMSAAVAQLAPVIGPALQDLLARLGSSPAGSPPPGAPGGPPADPGAEVDAYVQAVGLLTAAHPELLTAERWALLRAAWAQLSSLAASRGLA